MATNNDQANPPDLLEEEKQQQQAVDQCNVLRPLQRNCQELSEQQRAGQAREQVSGLETTTSSTSNESCQTGDQFNITQTVDAIPSNIPIEENQAGPSTTSNVTDTQTESIYHLKWINWNTGQIPIVMQSINGPCPLIAIINVLSLRERLKITPNQQNITSTQLLTHIGECLMECIPGEMKLDSNALINIEQNISDAIEILPKLKTGLDVNVRFAGITDFEYTPELTIFDLLRIALYHGWLLDPSLTELEDAIGAFSYNQLVDYIITNKNSEDPVKQVKVLMAEEYLNRTASQLTVYGLGQLKEQIKENEIGILFRNNHFSTIFKRENQIFQLVTDHGYFDEHIIWESLDNIDGSSNFFDSNFVVIDVTNRQVTEYIAIDSRQKQMENDFLMALSLKQEEDNLFSNDANRRQQ